VATYCHLSAVLGESEFLICHSREDKVTVLYLAKAGIQLKNQDFFFVIPAKAGIQIDFWLSTTSKSEDEG